jgi:hypothetical protein
VSSSETKTLWRITQGERLRYGASIGVLGLSVAALMVVPLLVRWAIDGLRLGSELELSGWLSRLGAGVGLGPTQTLLTAAALACLGGTALAGALQYLRGRCCCIREIVRQQGMHCT